MSALIYCPFPDAETAREVGGALLDEGLIGCINIGAPIGSIFDWSGDRGEGEEIPALFKTDAALLERAIARIECLHPYDAPAIVGWPCIAGQATRTWLEGLTGGNPSESER